MMKLLTFLAILFFLSCQSTSESAKIDLKFNSEKWKIQNGADFPYREQMLENVIFNDSLRALNKTQLIHTLGVPDRAQDDYLYYTISQTLLGAWPLHKKTMVIKLTNNNHVEWIKIHE